MTWAAPAEASIDELVRACLTPDLLKPRWRRLHELAGVPATAGHCFVAAQAMHWLLGRPGGEWKGASLRTGPGPDDTHWVCRHSDGTVIDPTADQFAGPPDYSTAVNRGFSTRCMGGDEIGPCKRTHILLERVHELLGQGMAVAA